MQKKHIFSFFLLALLALLPACSLFKQTYHPVNLIKACYLAGGRLANQLDLTCVNTTPIQVTTFADLDDLSHSSSLGRLLPHQISSALRERGYLPVDIRLRSQDLLIQEKNGEFILSRKLDALETGIRSALFLLGTYSQIQDTVYINAKIVSSKDGVVLATTDFIVPKKFLGKTPAKEKNGPLTLRPSVRTRQLDPVTERPLPK